MLMFPSYSEKEGCQSRLSQGIAFLRFAIDGIIASQNDPVAFFAKLSNPMDICDISVKSVTEMNYLVIAT